MTTATGITVDRLLSSQPLTIEELFTMNKGQLRMIACACEIVELLMASGYTSLGWLNDPHSDASTRTILDNDFQDVFSNESGTYCIFVNQDIKQYYCIDMGD